MSPCTRLVCLALLTSACAPGGAPAGEAKSAAPAANATAREVRSARLEAQAWPRTLRVTGELAAFEEATLSAKVPGRLESLAVDLGARVAAGQLLATVDARDYELRLAQAEAALAAARARLGLPLADGDGKDEVDPESVAVVRQARAALDEAAREEKRAAEMVRTGVATQAASDNARSALLVAEGRLADALEEVQNRRAQVLQRRADLALARAQLSDTRIVAPFAGAVTARLAGTGDYLAAGAPIARLVRFDPLRLRLDVPERSALEVHVGQALDVELEGGRHVPASLARLSPALGARSRSLLVEAELQNADGALVPGSFARAEIVLDPAARTLVAPLEALVRFAGIDKLLEVVDGKLVERRVEVGRVEGARIEILRGAAEGAELVLAPGSLQGGAAVRVVR